MAGLLTQATYDRFETAATQAAVLSGAGRVLSNQAHAFMHDVSVGGIGGSADTLPKQFDIVTVNPDGTPGVWIFLSDNIIQRFTVLNALDEMTSQWFATGTWVKVYGSRFIDSENLVKTGVHIYLVADYSVSVEAMSPALAVVMVTDDVERGERLPPFISLAHVGELSVNDEWLPTGATMDELTEWRPSTPMLAYGYGLRLSDLDFDRNITHLLYDCGTVDTIVSQQPYGEDVYSILAHNKDIRTYVTNIGMLVGDINWTLTANPSAVTQRGLTFSPDTASSVRETQPVCVVVSDMWLGFASLPPAGTVAHVTLPVGGPAPIGPTATGMPVGLFVHGGYLNGVPARSYTLSWRSTAEGGAVAYLVPDFTLSRGTEYAYHYGMVYVAYVSASDMQVGDTTGYVVQQAVACDFILSRTVPESPAEGTLFPVNHLTLNFAGVVTYSSMIQARTVLCQRYDKEDLGGSRPTPEDPLDPEAVDMQLCDSEVSGAELDLNSEEAQMGVAFPTSDKTTGKLVGCATILRLPVVTKPDAAELGVTYVEDQTSLSEVKARKVALQGVTEKPATKTVQRLYAYRSDDIFGLVELENLVQLDTTSGPKFVIDPSKQASNSKMLTHNDPTATWNFTADKANYDSVTVRIIVHEWFDISNNKLKRAYRDITLPRSFVSAVTAEQTEVILEGLNC